MQQDAKQPADRGFKVWLAMQVVDWEEGGRTTAAHMQRIFDKEQAAGPSSVQAIIHRYSLPSQLFFMLSFRVDHHTHSRGLCTDTS